MMNKMTNDNIVEEALSQLNMKYRSVTYKKSLIYFVTTENGTIFDISIGENGKIRFWKFINPELLTEKARKGVEYRKTKNGKISGGLHVTKDGDFEVYVEQKMDLNDEMSGKILEKQIKIFAQFINGLDRGKVKWEMKKSVSFKGRFMELGKCRKIKENGRFEKIDWPTFLEKTCKKWGIGG